MFLQRHDEEFMQTLLQTILHLDTMYPGVLHRFLLAIAIKKIAGYGFPNKPTDPVDIGIAITVITTSCDMKEEYVDSKKRDKWVIDCLGSFSEDELHCENVIKSPESLERDFQQGINSIIEHYPSAVPIMRKSVESSSYDLRPLILAGILSYIERRNINSLT